MRALYVIGMAIALAAATPAAAESWNNPSWNHQSGYGGAPYPKGGDAGRPGYGYDRQGDHDKGRRGDRDDDHRGRYDDNHRARDDDDRRGDHDKGRRWDHDDDRRDRHDDDRRWGHDNDRHWGHDEGRRVGYYGYAPRAAYRGEWTQEWREGRCFYQRRWERDGDYRETVRCDRPVRAYPVAPVAAPVIVRPSVTIVVPID